MARLGQLCYFDCAMRPGERFLAARGTLAGQIQIAEDFELTGAEIGEMVDDELV